MYWHNDGATIRSVIDVPSHISDQPITIEVFTMPKKTISIITDGTKLDAAIVEVNKRANSLADSIQLVLASAVYQATHGRNTNHLNATLAAAGRGVRKTAIAQWVLAHAPVVMETDKEKAKESPFRFSSDRMAELFPEAANHKAITAEEAMAHAEAALAMHWTEHKEPPLVPESFDIMAQVKKLMQTAKTMQTKGVKIVHGDMLAKLQAAMPVADQADVQSV